jgi:hypothetical protein
VNTSRGGFVLASSTTARTENITYWLMVPRKKEENEHYLMLIRDEKVVDFKFISREWADLLKEKWRSPFIYTRDH